MRIWLLGILAFLISCSPKTIPSDQSDPVISEQGSAIVMEVNEDNPEKTFEQIVSYLSDVGFRPHFVDYRLFTVETAYEPIGEIGAASKGLFRIHAFVKDSTVHFRGEVRKGKKNRAITKDRRNTLSQKAWQRMMELVERYPGGKEFYSVNYTSGSGQ